MAGKNGGARPGAGRKRKETTEEQLSRRDVLLEVFTVAEWREIARLLLAAAKGGNLMILLPYLPYLLGSPRQEINVTFDVQEAAADLAAQYGVPPERVVSLVERLKAKRAG
jgi:hypothetical protein